MLVELKNGETLNGHLVTCDTWMNLTLKEVVQTSPVSVHLYEQKHEADASLQLQQSARVGERVASCHCVIAVVRVCGGLQLRKIS
jgi:small nuclear ribonucleoprotein (snRNP)-like protein